MKKVKKVFPIFFIVLMLGFTGCSSSSNEDAKMSKDNTAAMDSSTSSNGEKASVYSGETDNSSAPKEQSILKVPNKMVIYQADLRLRVKKFEQTVKKLEEKAETYGGYIASSNVTREGKEQVSGSITIRIPQKNFQAFLHDAEGQAAEVLQRNITGQDVTEEYVDLESRLKSKRVVEERLLSFMKTATKTEDLLKISADLATVQEEIETIEGKMKFLENQTSFSTITITLYENKVIVPDIERDKLNTWEKTKKQFMKSINMLISVVSGLVVFIIGNLPILVILAILGFVGVLIYRKKKNRNGE
ncbi:DUF4349 domain-containing protein [Neobacillus sp. NRS-1170]|uniref:DUF4349 domain-containing protein n=1 Tax=Neobacillus sp. NRS-1170 TaxID=3233898 RepID=UPI003D2C6ACD